MPNPVLSPLEIDKCYRSKLFPDKVSVKDAPEPLNAFMRRQPPTHAEARRRAAIMDREFCEDVSDGNGGSDASAGDVGDCVGSHVGLLLIGQDHMVISE